jgi:hypothetical protein
MYIWVKIERNNGILLNSIISKHNNTQSRIAIYIYLCRIHTHTAVSAKVNPSVPAEPARVAYYENA